MCSLAIFSLVLLNICKIQLLPQHTPLFKAGFIEGWRIIRKVTNLVYFKWHSILQYIFLSLNIWICFACPLLSSRLLNDHLPMCYPTFFLDYPLTAAPMLSVCALQVLLSNVLMCWTDDSTTGSQGPTPLEGLYGYTHHFLIMQYVFFLGFFFSNHFFLDILHLFTFCRKPSDIFAVYNTSVSHFIDVTSKLIYSPNGNFREDTFSFTVWVIVKLPAVRLIVIFSSL